MPASVSWICAWRENWREASSALMPVGFSGSASFSRLALSFGLEEFHRHAHRAQNQREDDHERNQDSGSH
jgi:hypothetical protein